MSELERCINERCRWLGITAADWFVDAVVEKVQTDADDLWNEFDVIIGIRNVVNEMIENFRNTVNPGQKMSL